MKKIIFYLKELYLEYSNQVPSYIKIGERQKWLKEQEEEFIPLFVSEADTDLWRKKTEEAAENQQLLDLILLGKNWKSFKVKQKPEKHLDK